MVHNRSVQSAVIANFAPKNAPNSSGFESSPCGKFVNGMELQTASVRMLVVNKVEVFRHVNLEYF